LLLLLPNWKCKHTLISNKNNVMDDLLPGFTTAGQLSNPGRQLFGFDLHKDGQKSLLQSIQYVPEGDFI
jgi:hypothetical protein